ncbi:hypothetical protein GF326_06070 [Candidatus Bathyarchaeota archaeon]|nr:hypothetical protein [Candidatus Bathyarchaeota archaeon]
MTQGFVVIQSDWVYSGTSKVILTLSLRNNSTWSENADLEIQPLDADGNVILDKVIEMTQYATTGDILPGDSWTQEFLFQKSGIRTELNVFQILITGDDTLIEGDKLSTFNIEQSVYTSGGGTTLPLRSIVGYMSGTVDKQRYPKYRYYDTAWSEEIEIITPVSDKVRDVRVEFNPNPSYNDRAVMVILTDDGYLEAYDYDGFSWSTPTTLARIYSNAQYRPEKPFDIAFEKTSGNCLVIYNNELNNNGLEELAYRIFDGYSWSQEYYLNDPKIEWPGSGVDFKWISLATDYSEASNNIGFVAFDAGWWDYVMAIWNGTNWTDWKKLDQGPWDDDGLSCDVAWEYSSGDCMVTFSEGDDIGYLIWNGSWSNRYSQQLTNNAWNGWTWLKLKPQLTEESDRMMLLALDKDGQYAAAIDWEGNSWNGIRTVLDTQLESAWGRCIDGDWESTGTQFLVAAGDRNVDAISYKTWTPGGGWSHSTNNWATYASGYGNDQV